LNWLVEATKDQGDTVVAGAFANVWPDRPGQHKFQAWLRHLSSIGYHVGVKDKDEDTDSDVDEMMIAFIRKNLPDVRRVIIGSHDARRFSPLIIELEERGINTVVLGFAELANGYAADVNFIDIGRVPRVFATPPPRHIPIHDLPPEGAVFPPSGKPRARPSKATPAKRVNPPRVAQSASN
jgi:hypothetical protein